MPERPKFIPEQKKEEEKKVEGVSRRSFLKNIAAGAALGFAGLEATGCATSNIGMKTEKIHRGLGRFSRKIEDPNNYLEYLREREFVIQDEIFDSYARTVDKRPRWLSNPVGGYMSKNYLDKKEEIVEFRRRLEKLGLSKKEVGFYESLFTSTDLIIFRESILKIPENSIDIDFLEALPHERFHKQVKRLSKKEFGVLERGAKGIMNKYEEKFSSGSFAAAAKMNWEEFYTYLAQGEFGKKIEDALEKNYPEAYKIYAKIRDDCRLEK